MESRRFKNLLGPLALAGLDSILPPACVLCASSELLAKPRQSFCNLCLHSILNSWPPKSVACEFCGMPRPCEPVPPLDQPCYSCPAVPFAFDRVIALGIYQSAIREGVVAAKRSKHAALAAAMGTLLGDVLVRRFTDGIPDRITSVPSHFLRRFHRRGVAGASVIGASVADRLGGKYTPLLRVTRAVKKQSMLPDVDRPANVRDAFAMKRSYAFGKEFCISDLHILLVDDVLTSGSTASEIANVLKAAGAASVTLAVVARAVRR